MTIIALLLSGGVLVLGFLLHDAIHGSLNKTPLPRRVIESNGREVQYATRRLFSFHNIVFVVCAIFCFVMPFTLGEALDDEVGAVLFYVLLIPTGFAFVWALLYYNIQGVWYREDETGFTIRFLPFCEEKTVHFDDILSWEFSSDTLSDTLVIHASEWRKVKVSLSLFRPIKLLEHLQEMEKREEFERNSDARKYVIDMLNNVIREQKELYAK